jgi:hypothetical protein
MRSLACALMVFAADVVQAQGFGGSPPWGPEKPVAFSREIGPTGFEHPIGSGLVFSLVRADGDFQIAITPAGGGADYSGCVTGPFHGPNARDITASDLRDKAVPRGLGVKRRIDFVLTLEDDRRDCEELEKVLRLAENSWWQRVSGRCWFRPTAVKLSDDPPEKQTIESLAFDVECAPHGALELWRLPATYVVPDGFTGWVMVLYRQKAKPELHRTGDRYVVPVGSETIRTSSDLRQDRRGAAFANPGGQTIPATRIWGWEAGDADSCSPYQTFFVGSRAEFQRSPQNPALKNPAWDCSAVLRP